MEEILDLAFGRCKLQVQVPVKGGVDDSRELIGKNIVTSFTGLAQSFFAKLEGHGDVSKLRTKVKYVGGSVEAACALGVADGIIDLVGQFYHHMWMGAVAAVSEFGLTRYEYVRIWRNHESCWTQSH